MNYLLDTNIIIILFEGRNNEIRDNVKQILLDDENNFYVSTISLLEIAQLYRKKKFKNINYELLNTGDKFIKHILQRLVLFLYLIIMTLTTLLLLLIPLQKI